MSTLDSKIPDGPIADKWTKYKDHINLVNPANKRQDWPEALPLLPLPSLGIM